MSFFNRSGLKTCRPATSSHENQRPGQTPKVLSTSKKIQKSQAEKSAAATVTRQVFRDITNQCQSQNSSRDLKKFAEDKEKPVLQKTQTKLAKNYIGKTQTTLKFINRTSKQVHSFNCFLDKELQMPQQFAEKTIQHSCDNDCMTDDDQVKGAIRVLYKALETSISERKALSGDSASN